jgi:hypothetical protein
MQKRKKNSPIEHSPKLQKIPKSETCKLGKKEKRKNLKNAQAAPWLHILHLIIFPRSTTILPLLPRRRSHPCAAFSEDFASGHQAVRS